MTETPDDTAVVVRGAASGFAQEVRVRSHRLRGDEPASGGGTDTGPSPYEFLLTALGTCTSMTIALYARRKQWPLEEVTVRLRHARSHASDSAACETNDVRIDRIEREISLDGSLSPEQRDRLLEIANRCPVHRTLTSEVVIDTRLAADGPRTS